MYSDVVMNDRSTAENHSGFVKNVEKFSQRWKRSSEVFPNGFPDCAIEDASRLSGEPE